MAIKNVAVLEKSRKIGCKKTIVYVINKILEQIMPSKSGERYPYSFNQSTVENSSWKNHYVIYKEFLKYTKNVATLDLCCGSGAGSKYLATQLEANVIGVDYSKYAIKYCKNHNNGSNLQFMLVDLHTDADMIKNIITDNCIKQVFFIEGIEHIKNDIEIIDLLLKNGVQKIFISTPYEDHSNNKWHVNIITKEKMQSLQDMYNLNIIGYRKSETTPVIVQEPDNSLNYLFIISNKNSDTV